MTSFQVLAVQNLPSIPAQVMTIRLLGGEIGPDMFFSSENGQTVHVRSIALGDHKGLDRNEYTVEFQMIEGDANKLVGLAFNLVEERA